MNFSFVLFSNTKKSTVLLVCQGDNLVNGTKRLY